MTDHDGMWECPACKTKAKIEGRNITVFPPPSFNFTWPLHRDCQLGNDIDHIDFSKLTKVD